MFNTTISELYMRAKHKSDLYTSVNLLSSVLGYAGEIIGGLTGSKHVSQQLTLHWLHYPAMIKSGAPEGHCATGP